MVEMLVMPGRAPAQPPEKADCGLGDGLEESFQSPVLDNMLAEEKGKVAEEDVGTGDPGYALVCPKLEYPSLESLSSS